MGVTGLMTFLRENRNSIGSITYCQPLSEEELERGEQIALVVDAWSFIWALYNDHLPWAAGGEYLAFDRLIRQVLDAWLRIGLKPYFVFDGPTPLSKHATVLSRLHRPLQTSLLFYRTSPQSRSSPSFLSSAPILPPFAFHVLRDVLASREVTAFHLAEGEADGACVALATELNGFVLGNDSDFAIFGGSGASSSSGGYRGYVPIETLQWIASTSGQSQAAEDDGFAPVKSSRMKGKKATTSFSHHLAPPPFNSPSEHPTLVLLSFHPSGLASRLRIPPTHLPLLASILGTDHSPPEAPALLFHSKESKMERIDKVARIIREALTPLGQSRIAKLHKSRTLSKSGSSTSSDSLFTSSNGIAEAGDQAYLFIHYIITSLLPPPNPRAQASALTPDGIDRLVSQMIDSCCQYILPPSPQDRGASACCQTFPFCSCPSSESSPLASVSSYPTEAQASIQEARSSYAQAQSCGYLSHLSAFAHTDRAYLWGILEDPEGACLRSSEGSRAIRRAAWDTVVGAVGGLRGPAELSSVADQDEEDSIMEDQSADGVEEDGEDEDEDEDEMIDVGSESEDEDEGSSKSIETDQAQVAMQIVEYLRSGSSTRLVAVPMALSLTRNVTPAMVLGPVGDTRIRQLLEYTSASNPATLALDPTYRPLVAIIRTCISSSTNKKKQWTRKEVELALTAGIVSFDSWNTTQRPTAADDPVLLETRATGLISQVLAAMLDIQQLAQALLLSTPSQDPSQHWATLYQFFEGAAWHRHLNAKSVAELKKPLSNIRDECMVAIGEGLEESILGWQTWQLSGKGEKSAKGKASAGGPSLVGSKASTVNNEKAMGRYEALARY